MISVKPPSGITPTLVKQYAYCPVLIWLKSWLLVEEPSTDSMRIGRESTKPPEGRGQVFIKSKLGSAVVDEVSEEKEGRVIVEKKTYTSYNQSRYVEQAVAAYIVARESIPGIRLMKLELGSKAKTVELCSDLVEEVEKIAGKVREIVEHEKSPPRPGDPRKCTSCWYKRYCPYW